MTAETSTRTARPIHGPPRRRPRPPLALPALLALLVWPAGPAPRLEAAPPEKAPAGEELPEATAPTGASVLARMGLSLDRTSLGRVAMVGNEPAALAGHGGLPRTRDWQRHGFALDGRDLYRYSCRACHGPGGQGMPPEIRPLAARARETSAGAGERARLERAHRIEGGGTMMPALAHLTDREIDALRGYLEALAGAPETSRPSPGPTLAEPADRVGEHVVKGTCQICHDATAGAAQRPIYDRQIPPLAEIPERYSVREFLRKARSGATVAHGTRGRMPQLAFLEDEELTAAYFYLTEHGKP